MKKIFAGLTVLFAFVSLPSFAQLNPLANNITNTVPKASEMGSANYTGLTSVGFESVADKRQQRVKDAASPAKDMSAKLTMIVAINKLENVLHKISDIKAKFAARLNVLPAMLLNENLFESVDEWFGTRYVYGGTSKSGIDCSAFTRAVFKAAYGLQLPRTAREQYGDCARISATDLQEGDLVFFNTTGGVSHVGIYLNNNKFAHASCSRGVTISDLYEPYYMSHFIGGGRVDKSALIAMN